MKQLKSIDLNLFEKLQDKEFRDAFFEQEFLDDNALDIRALRKFRKMRQVDVAAATGMQQSAVSRLEQAEYSNWNCKTLLRLAQALDAKLTITWQPAEYVVENYQTIGLGANNLSVLNAREQALADSGNLKREAIIPFEQRLTEPPSHQPMASPSRAIAETILGAPE